MSRQTWTGNTPLNLPTILNLSESVVDIFNRADLDPKTEAVIAPPCIHIIPLRMTITQKTVKIGAHNSRQGPSGEPIIGETSLEHLRDANISDAILGHSDRRTILKEDPKSIAETTLAATGMGFSVILCIARTADKALNDILLEQLQPVIDLDVDWSKIVMAYQPAGFENPFTPEQIQADHLSIRAFVFNKVSPEVANKIRIVFGDFVDATKIKKIAQLPDVDGFLVNVPLAGATPSFVDFINAWRNTTEVSASRN